jgi:hypothetical protein
MPGGAPFWRAEMKRLQLVGFAVMLASLVSDGAVAWGQVRTPRQERRLERQEQRLNNRVQYYNQQSWTQLDPWITRNQVPAANRAARVANAAVAGAATANAVANAATNNTRFGYANAANAQPGWFYDYYTYSPTYYSAPASGAKVYGSAARYHDLNGDGVYDSLSTFRDSDNNGVYDVYDRYDFAEAQKEQTQSTEGLVDAPMDASRHSVTGKIEATKMAKVNGSENLVVRIAPAGAGDNSDVTIVDLGPADRWQSGAVKEGDQLNATGPVEQIGEKLVLIAESASVGQSKAVSVSRSAPVLEGQVVDVTRAEVKGAEHTLAILDNGSTRQIVDLGPTTGLKVAIQPQAKIAVRGVPVQVRDRNVIMAETVDVNGQQITIQRW